VETYTEERPLVEDHGFRPRKDRSRAEIRELLRSGAIDPLMTAIVEEISSIPCCYTIQSCGGHFIRLDVPGEHDSTSVPDSDDSGKVLRYRIAYIAFCVERSEGGRRLLDIFRAVAETDPEYIQFGCASWFWERCVNSYIVQVGPRRNASEDSFEIGLVEARRVEMARELFFEGLRRVAAESRMMNWESMRH
jgi:hypothetical protein